MGRTHEIFFRHAIGLQETVAKPLLVEGPTNDGALPLLLLGNPTWE
jgi:hypothetical protein